jgi:hypothetical protein
VAGAATAAGVVAYKLTKDKGDGNDGENKK